MNSCGVFRYLNNVCNRIFGFTFQKNVGLWFPWTKTNNKTTSYLFEDTFVFQASDSSYCSKNQLTELSIANSQCVLSFRLIGYLRVNMQCFTIIRCRELLKKSNCWKQCRNDVLQFSMEFKAFLVVLSADLHKVNKQKVLQPPLKGFPQTSGVNDE